MKNYFRLFWGISFVLSGFGFTKNYFSDSTRRLLQEKINSYEKLEKTGTKILASLDSQYTETTVKIMKVPVKMYSAKYFFSVNGNTYEGEYSSSKPPTVQAVEVYYLQEDPSINDQDPAKELQHLRASKESKTSLYFGLFLLVIGAALTFNSINEIRKVKKERNDARQREIDEFNRERGIYVSE